MGRLNTKKGAVAIFLTVFVIGLLMLSGPASAVIVSTTQPNDTNKGSDVSFSTTVDIKDPDLLPVQYTTITITGPNGFIKTCKVNNDGTDDCPEVDFIVSQSNLNSINGNQYGYDENDGINYNLGYGYGYQNPGGIGTITYDVVWHTPSTLEDGTYSVIADVFAQGSINSHTFSSSTKSFLISTPSTSPTGGGGGGSSNRDYTSTVPTPVVTPVTPVVPPTTPETPEEETTPEEPGEGMTGITGQVIGTLTNLETGWPYWILVLIIFGIAGYYTHKKFRE